MTAIPATIARTGRFYNEDPGEPYVLFDCYPQDRGESPDFADAELSDVDGDGDADVVGGILKAMDGLGWGKYNCDWAIQNASRILGLVGLYHYFQAQQDPVGQADAYHWVRAEAIKKTPSLEGRLIIPIVDVESGSERSSNARASKAQWEDGVSKFNERMFQLEGRRTMLYGRGTMRDQGITSKMGCSSVWLPAYTSVMELNGITHIENRWLSVKETDWKLEDVVLWQAFGDGSGLYSKLPNSILGLGKIDLSVHVNGKQPPTMQSLLKALL